MTFKKFLPVFTALLTALLLVLASFSAMAAGDIDSLNDPPAPVIEATDEPAETTETVEGNSEAPSTGHKQNDDTQPSTAGDSYNPGDIDGNGSIDINDVTTLQSVFVGLAPRTETVVKNGDTNVDGKINIWDATVIQLRIANIYKELPVTVDGYYARIIQP